VRRLQSSNISIILADRAKTPRHKKRCPNFAAYDRAERRKSRKFALRATIRSFPSSFRTVCTICEQYRSHRCPVGPGLQADLALYSLDEPRFSGAQDPIAALALCGAHRADRVMVAGRWRVIDGAPEGIDLEALIAKHKAAARAFA
jgi:hypothetical protein